MPDYTIPTIPQRTRLIKQKVTYTLLKEDKFFIIENVPARVNMETGEQLFSPETVAQLQRIIQEKKKPIRRIETPVFQYSS